MFEVTTGLFREYMGTGLTVIWFMVAWFYLLFMEKRKPIRIMFVYVPGLVLLVFFNPLFYGILQSFIGEEIYYRLLWLVPFSVVIALAAVHLYKRLAEKKRYLFALMVTVLIMISGSYIYSNPFFRKAENIYHVPQSVVDICDSIQVEGREVMAVFPAELVQYVRQYSPVICMPYGRDTTVPGWKKYKEINIVINEEEIDAQLLCQLAKEETCHYIILKQEQQINGNMASYDYELFKQIEGYDIYKDCTISLEY
ncbi:MAG: hypothetical protein K6G30_11640 [Acetatifactor sp.]|nr:hypothetical protein [Acetatifactor sp.]